MIIEIDEEEREFLERICVRAELFSTMNVFRSNISSSIIFEKDMHAIRTLKIKFENKKLREENEMGQ